jgi:hypothetical protein
MPLVILHHLLNVSVQLANKRGFKRKLGVGTQRIPTVGTPPTAPRNGTSAAYHACTRGALHKIPRFGLNCLPAGSNATDCTEATENAAFSSSSTVVLAYSLRPSNDLVASRTCLQRTTKQWASLLALPFRRSAAMSQYRRISQSCVHRNHQVEIKFHRQELRFAEHAL